MGVAGGKFYGSAGAAARILPRGVRPYMRVAAFRLPSRALRRMVLVRHLHRNAETSASMGSELNRRLLMSVADDVAAGGPCWSVFSAYRPNGPVLDDGIGFRFMAGMHRLVLSGRAPTLARFYPSVGGRNEGDPWPAFRDVVAANVDELRGLMERGLQTNEVGRCRALVGGFLTVARESGLPLRLLEVGASAGLNLRWDRYRYEAGGEAWGDAGSPVRILGGFADRVPRLDGDVQVTSREGCDLAPVDPTSEDDKLWLRASLWPDQTERQQLLEGALQIAAAVPAQVVSADAATWLGEKLAEPAEGTATVVYHSIVMRYLTTDGRREVTEIIERAGQRASRSAPLAWLSLEGPGGVQQITLRTWPGGEERLLGKADAQARRVRWLV